MRRCGFFDILTDDSCGRWAQRQTMTMADDVKWPLGHIQHSRVINNMTHRHLPYILSYKSKNVGQILALKTIGRLIRVSSFGQQLFRSCLCKSMADSCREMLPKHQQIGSMTATADDIKSVADVPMPTSMERCSLPVASACHHHPQTTHLPASTVSSRVAVVASCIVCTPPDALPLPGVLYEHHPQQRGDGGPAPVSTYMRVSNFERFLTSKEGVGLYANRLVHKYIWYVNFLVK